MQKEDESLYIYIKRWNNNKANASHIPDEMAVYVFQEGLRNKELIQKLVPKAPITLSASTFKVRKRWLLCLPQKKSRMLSRGLSKTRAKNNAPITESMRWSMELGSAEMPTQLIGRNKTINTNP